MTKKTIGMIFLVVLAAISLAQVAAQDRALLAETNLYTVVPEQFLHGQPYRDGASARRASQRLPRLRLRRRGAVRGRHPSQDLLPHALAPGRDAAARRDRQGDGGGGRERLVEKRVPQVERQCDRPGRVVGHCGPQQAEVGRLAADVPNIRGLQSFYRDAERPQRRHRGDVQGRSLLESQNLRGGRVGPVGRAHGPVAAVGRSRGTR